ncbi:hypothetical protein BC831DRAFT_515096 [Entophlyctis helioformis]|nr:hypothetical protein BC831DRAFT_515096 [Entophlyctis helioformis]
MLTHRTSSAEAANASAASASGSGQPPATSSMPTSGSSAAAHSRNVSPSASVSQCLGSMGIQSQSSQNQHLQSAPGMQARVTISPTNHHRLIVNSRDVSPVYGHHQQQSHYLMQQSYHQHHQQQLQLQQHQHQPQHAATPNSIYQQQQAQIHSTSASPEEADQGSSPQSAAAQQAMNARVQSLLPPVPNQNPYAGNVEQGAPQPAHPVYAYATYDDMPSDQISSAREMIHGSYVSAAHSGLIGVHDIDQHIHHLAQQQQLHSSAGTPQLIHTYPSHVQHHMQVQPQPGHSGQHAGHPTQYVVLQPQHMQRGLSEHPLHYIYYAATGETPYGDAIHPTLPPISGVPGGIGPMRRQGKQSALAAISNPYSAAALNAAAVARHRSKMPDATASLMAAIDGMALPRKKRDQHGLQDSCYDVARKDRVKPNQVKRNMPPPSPNAGNGNGNPYMSNDSGASGSYPQQQFDDQGNSNPSSSHVSGSGSGPGAVDALHQTASQSQPQHRQAHGATTNASVSSCDDANADDNSDDNDENMMTEMAMLQSPTAMTTATATVQDQSLLSGVDMLALMRRAPAVQSDDSSAEHSRRNSLSETAGAISLPPLISSLDPSNGHVRRSSIDMLFVDRSSRPSSPGASAFRVPPNMSLMGISLTPPASTYSGSHSRNSSLDLPSSTLMSLPPNTKPHYGHMVTPLSTRTSFAAPSATGDQLGGFRQISAQGQHATDGYGVLYGPPSLFSSFNPYLGTSYAGLAGASSSSSASASASASASTSASTSASLTAAGTKLDVTDPSSPAGGTRRQRQPTLETLIE